MSSSVMVTVMTSIAILRMGGRRPSLGTARLPKPSAISSVSSWAFATDVRILAAVGTGPPSVGELMCRMAPMMRVRLSWMLWCLLLTTCPVTIAALGMIYERHTPSIGPHWSWPARAVNGLFLIHLLASLLALIQSPRLVGRSHRWLAWTIIPGLIVFIWFLGFWAIMATTGIYL